MYTLGNDTDSVNLLIRRLCHNFYLEQNQNAEVSATTLRQLKAQSFAILLKKSAQTNTCANIENENLDNVQILLDRQIFVTKLQCRNNQKKCTEIDAFEEDLKHIWQEPYFTAGAGRSVLQLLLTLQGNVRNEEKIDLHAPKLLVPGPFTLHANYQQNLHYPSANILDIMMPVPVFFKGTHQIKHQDDPFVPKFAFSQDIKKCLPKSISSIITFRKYENGKVELEQPVSDYSMPISARPFQLYDNIFDEESQNQLEFQQQNNTQLTIASSKITCTVMKSRVFAWNWENLGQFGITCSKPFTSDTNVVLDLQCYHNQLMDKEFTAKILTQKHILYDLKLLTVGIQSDTFEHDGQFVFKMKPQRTIEGVLPSTFKGCLSGFLICGTCYKRLQTMISNRDYKPMFEGFVFKTLCKAIAEYLLTFRQFVFAQEDNNMMTFYQRMKKSIEIISNLSATLDIHPNVDISIKPPMGSQLLGYLYREAMRFTAKDYITLLVFILKRCCHVYFKHLQKWIFYGLLDDPCNELFIGFVDHYRPNTKHFYDKAYFVRRESVPGFFQNYEDQILQCGKYTMLLKAYKPHHPIFDLEYPVISLCLSFEEIQKLESGCCKYYKSAQERCGKPVTIREIFEKDAIQKQQFFSMVSQRSRKNMERWLVEQNEQALITAEYKKKRLEELAVQLQDVRERKIRERRANVEHELKILREAERLDERRQMRENINLRKRIEYYQELSDIMQLEEGREVSEKNSDPLCNQNPTHDTPGSTDFESCCGDDDEASEYAECLSDDFVQKFADNESELASLCASKVEPLVDCKKQHAKEESNLDNKPGEDYSGTSVDAATIKLSVSDMLNSNEIPALVMSVMQEKRQKALSGANVINCFKTMQDSNSAEKTDIQIVMPFKQKEIAKPLTDAQKNKLKVLSEEFDVLKNNPTECIRDVNLNILPNEEMSELQRNRKRMMENDLFSNYNKVTLADRATLQLNLNTERARNRQKVLESEFNILTGQKPSTGNVTLDHASTPMSTTSDTPLADHSNSDILKAETHKVDLENGNVPTAQKNKDLKLDVELANDHINSELTLPTGLSLCNTSQLDVTPESALNTAGLMMKQGFQFDSIANTENTKEQTLINIDAPIHNEHDLYLAEPTFDYNTHYQRCAELIESNFRCPTRCQFFRLNYWPTCSAMSLTIKNDTSDPKRQPKEEEINLDSISVITLTEFLQKSVVIPLQTHLQLISNEVMRLFLEDLYILEHLQSLRDYFLLMDGEFGAIICDGLIGKLEDGATPQKLLNYQMLHSILDTALGSSITGHDKNAENLSFIVSDVPEKFDLFSPGVLDNLSLSYRVGWPLNLLLNPETLEQYANIFKYLIKVRRISWVLERAYQTLKVAVKTHGPNILKSPQYCHVQQIRHKFYHFVHALQNHIAANALHASWKTFKDNLLQAKSIEDIYRKHTLYVKRILFLCMLNRRSTEFYNTIENIFKITLRFFYNLKMRDFKKLPNEEHFTHSRYDKLANDEQEFDKFIKYTIYLGNKIVRHGYQAEIGEFISLINYNQYYTERNI